MYSHRSKLTRLVLALYAALACTLMLGCGVAVESGSEDVLGVEDTEQPLRSITFYEPGVPVETTCLGEWSYYGSLCTKNNGWRARSVYYYNAHIYRASTDPAYALQRAAADEGCVCLRIDSAGNPPACYLTRETNPDLHLNYQHYRQVKAYVALTSNDWLHTNSAVAGNCQTTVLRCSQCPTELPW